MADRLGYAFGRELLWRRDGRGLDRRRKRPIEFGVNCRHVVDELLQMRGVANPVACLPAPENPVDSRPGDVRDTRSPPVNRAKSGYFLNRCRCRDQRHGTAHLPDAFVNCST